MLSHQTSILIDLRATQEGEWACHDLKIAEAPGARATGGFNAVRSMVIFLNYSMDCVILLNALSQSKWLYLGWWCLLLTRDTQTCQQPMSEIRFH